MLTQQVFDEEEAADEQLSIEVEHVAAAANGDRTAALARGKATREAKRNIAKTIAAV